MSFWTVRSVMFLMLSICIIGAWAYSIRSRYIREAFDASCTPEVNDLDKPFDPDLHLTSVNGDIWDVNREDDDPWQRHSVNGSVAVDPHVKFDRTYYYELDNAKYTAGLRKALVVSCSLIADAVNNSKWSERISTDRENPIESDVFTATQVNKNNSSNNIGNDDYNTCVEEVDFKHFMTDTVDPDFFRTRNSEYIACVEQKVRARTASSKLPSSKYDVSDAEVRSAYAACVSYVSKRLNASDALALPGSVSKHVPIQIVHDILRSYKVHLSSRSMYLIEIEALLYRENKYHAKHVNVTCVAKKQNLSDWIINVVAVRIVGVVPEDQIALFPVVASNPLESYMLRVEKDVETASKNVDCKIVFDEEKQNKKVVCSPSNTTTTGVVEHARKYQDIAKTELAVMKT